ncbi:hypothetical protein EMIHUDRAFT_213145 [Emiliania huxleyi CCMP1516]|uniref:Uncharacterized protein n=2 Tax=Emiliania huxleyi TaxID=2903 RepID=A0A0D3INS1_EMIH1|nr:hypothetical protein EMIHUDRAFT_213145 [Emiliania huxleyi CCMP1516]EOD12906.1 hypothetical protein EMIHUDRAFT_213145 [Emiliania huxleyi CCMP1516]|eukprot:XP_005765335.1 hypothetical protein EMIHUDRAFT_213145 [Emiliania huxleyi CCMP1516]
MPPPPDYAHAVPPGPRRSIPPHVHQLRRDIRNVDQGSWVLPIPSDRAYFTCKSLISVTFAHGLIAVNSAAFYACRSLKYVSLPDTLALLGPGAFEND